MSSSPHKGAPYWTSSEAPSCGLSGACGRGALIGWWVPRGSIMSQSAACLHGPDLWPGTGFDPLLEWLNVSACTGVGAVRLCSSGVAVFMPFHPSVSNGQAAGMPKRQFPYLRGDIFSMICVGVVPEHGTGSRHVSGVRVSPGVCACKYSSRTGHYQPLGLVPRRGTAREDPTLGPIRCVDGGLKSWIVPARLYLAYGYGTLLVGHMPATTYIRFHRSPCYRVNNTLQCGARSLGFTWCPFP
jgi:hypothetical protein